MAQKTTSNGAKRSRLDGQSSVVIRAAQIIAAIGADELAAVARESMAAGRTDLAVVIDRGFGNAGFRHTSGSRL